MKAAQRVFKTIHRFKILNLSEGIIYARIQKQYA